MIGLDTNVIIRHLVQDDPVQSRKASALFEKSLTANVPGFVCVVTMVETAWVLERAYGFSNPDVAAAVGGLLATDSLIIESEDEVFSALAMIEEDGASFADALILSLGAKAGCARTLTFDRKASALPGFELL